MCAVIGKYSRLYTTCTVRPTISSCSHNDSCSQTLKFWLVFPFNNTRLFALNFCEVIDEAKG